MSSWFSEMAGKAETFLNAMDQTAAAALSGSMSETTGRSGDKQESMASDSTAIVPHLVTYQPRYTPTPVAPPVQTTSHSRNSSIGSSFSTVSSRDVHSNGTIVNSIFTPTTHRTSRGRADRDEKMFDFLNSKSVPTSKASSNGRSSRRSDEDQSIASIEVVSVSSDEGRHETSGKGSPVSDGKGENIADTDSPPDTIPEEEKEEQLQVNEEREAEAAADVISSLEKEISVLTARNVAAETEVKRLSKRLENWQNQLSSSDASLRELQAREEDLRSAIRVRDESISILKVRLQESDELLKAKSETLGRLKQDHEVLVQEHARTQANLDQDMVSLQTRLKELEEEILLGKESLQKAQSESMAQIGLLEDNNRVLVDEIASAQRELRSEKNTRKECEKQLKQLKSSYESLTAEFDEYKSKAVKTLQSKDELIRSLQRKSHDGDEGIADTNDFQVDFDESSKQTLVLQTQCDSLVQDVQDFQARYESLKSELEQLRNGEMEDLYTRISVLNDELDQERSQKVDLENDMHQVQEELKYAREDFARIKSSLQTRIEDRDRELEQLRKQMVTKRSTVSDTAVQELEQRCKGLAHSLIQKQTLIEQLSSERHTLALQLERSDARLRNALEENSIRSQMSSPSVSIGMHSSTSSSNVLNQRSSGSYRAFMEEDVADGRVTRRVKRVYSQFDSFFMQIGRFLRVYPPARAFLLLYVLFLHFWVFFVLFSYRPEIHDQEP